jgi:hypothetical protein
MMIKASSVAFDPLLPLPILAAIATPALLLCLYALARLMPGALLRLLTLVLLVLTLLNPSLVTEQRNKLRDTALIMVDRSPSQNIGERNKQAEAALVALQTKLAALPDLDVRVAEGPRGGDETRLFSTMTQALADVPESRRAGVIIISDGQIHDVPAVKDAPQLGPVQLLLTGKPGEVDRRVRLVSAPGYGIVGQTVNVVVRVEDLPERQSDTATLQLHREDGRTETRVVNVGQDVGLSIPISHAGLNLLALELQPLKGEVSTANNRAAVIINGVRDKLRVLLISGFPHNGERVWRNLLKSDPAVEMVHFTIMRQPHKFSSVPENELSLIPFPVNELFAVKLRQFDLVIFDRYNDRTMLPFNYIMNVVDYVKNGGAVLDASGSDFASPDSLASTPLTLLLPSTADKNIIEGPFTPQHSRIGQRHPITAALDGNWGPWLRASSLNPQPGALTLLETAQQNPLLLLSEYQQGRVAQLASEHLWLWARGYQGGGPHGELLRSLVHWLMKEPELEAERLVANSTGDTLTITRHSLQASDAPVIARAPSGQNLQASMKDNGKLAKGSLTTSEPGIYRLSDGKLSTLALVGRPDAPELTDPRASPEKLQTLLDATNGGAFWLSDYPQAPELRQVDAGDDAAGRGWLGLARNNTYSVSGFTTLPLLPLALVAALILVSLLWGWRREGY